MQQGGLLLVDWKEKKEVPSLVAPRGAGFFLHGLRDRSRLIALRLPIRPLDSRDRRPSWSCGITGSHVARFLTRRKRTLYSIGTSPFPRSTLCTPSQLFLFTVSQLKTTNRVELCRQTFLIVIIGTLGWRLSVVQS